MLMASTDVKIPFISSPSITGTAPILSLDMSSKASASGVSLGHVMGRVVMAADTGHTVF